MNEIHDAAHAAEMAEQAARSKPLKNEHAVIPQRGVRMPRRTGAPAQHRERQPGKTSGWRRDKGRERRMPPEFYGQTVESFSIWRRRGLLMITSLELAEAPDGSKEIIPQFHVSISRERGETVEDSRPDDEEIRAALAGLGLVGAEEDNHHPGLARHFWWPLDPARRVDCECKVTEKVITEPGGYRWSTPADGIDCHGCELEVAAGVPCSIHGQAAIEPGESMRIESFNEQQLDERIAAMAAAAPPKDHES